MTWPKQTGNRETRTVNCNFLFLFLKMDGALSSYLNSKIAWSCNWRLQLEQHFRTPETKYKAPQQKYINNFFSFLFLFFILLSIFSGQQLVRLTLGRIYFCRLQLVLSYVLWIIRLSCRWGAAPASSWIYNPCTMVLSEPLLAPLKLISPTNPKKRKIKLLLLFFFFSIITYLNKI